MSTGTTMTMDMIIMIMNMVIIMSRNMATADRR